jgi:hypothetical protein
VVGEVGLIADSGEKGGFDGLVSGIHEAGIAIVAVGLVPGPQLPVVVGGEGLRRRLGLRYLDRSRCSR